MTTVGPETTENIDALLEARRSLDEREFEGLYRRYHPMLVRYARRQGATDPEGVADLALFDGYRGVDRLEHRREKSLRSYLYRAAYGHIHAERRRPGDLPAPIDDDVLVTDDPTDDVDRRHVVREAVSELSPGQRQVIEHRFFDDLTGDEVGELLGKDRNAVYQTQHRAIERLRARMIAAAVVAALLIAGVMAWQRGSGNHIVDNTPVDRSERPSATDIDEPVPAESIERDENGLPEPAVDLDADTPDRAESTELSATETSEPIVADDAEQSATGATGDPGTSEGPGAVAPPVGGSTPLDGGQAGGTVTSSPEGPSGAVGANGAPVDEAGAGAGGSTTATSNPPPTTTPAPVPTVLNACQVHQLSSTVHAVRLYNPASDPARMEAFVAPASIAFLDDAGRTLHVVDTSGPSTTGSASGNHGWLGIGGGTHARYQDVPAPVYWGVLVRSTAVAEWSSVAVFDADGRSLPWAAGLC